MPVARPQSQFATAPVRLCGSNLRVLGDDFGNRKYREEECHREIDRTPVLEKRA